MAIGAYEPLWIEGSRGRLHAALHRAGAATSAGAAVLLVPPLLHEHHRSQRFLCELASSLCEQGLTCLRFSFAGTGDSPGDGVDADCERMGADMSRARNVLRELSGCGAVVPLAFRSASLPLQPWIAREETVGAGPALPVAVLWSPVLAGNSWLDDVIASDRAKRATIVLDDPALAELDAGQLMGLPASPRLREEIAAIRWSDTAVRRAWAVRDWQAGAGSSHWEREFRLPAGQPVFETSALMDAALLFTPTLEGVARQLGDALRVAAHG